MIHPIKRYANRKLYDTADRRYVTLEDLGALIREGHQVEVTDNETGEDITGATLAQVIYEQQKRRGWPQSGELFHELIRAPAGVVGRLFEGGATVARTAGREGERLIRSFVGGEGPPTAPEAADPTPPEGEPVSAEDSGPSLRQWVGERIDESVRRVMDGLGVVTRSELDRVLAGLTELKAKLEALEARRAPKE